MLILARRTHLDQLAHKLEEERVRRVIEPLLSDAEEPRCDAADICFGRDVDYVRDLGLIAPSNGIRMANPIYAEVQAYLQRLVNGGGRIEREYGLGRGATDLLVLWPREAGQPSDLWERFVIECKVLRDSDRKSLEGIIERGVEQTFGYMAKCRAREGHLVVFDQRTGKPAGEAAGPEQHRRDAGSVALWLL